MSTVEQTSPVLRIVAPFARGGATDLITRLLAEQLQNRLGKPVAVDNQPGAGGTLGATRVAHGPADGSTLVMGTSSTHGICSAVFRTLPYDPVADFVPVAPVAFAPNVLVVSAASACRSVADLAAQARARPGMLTYGSAGFGQTIHLCGELFKSAAGIDIVHAPRAGSAVALEELAAGRLTLMFDSLLSALPYIRSGRLRALGLTSSTRSRALPDVPTLSEAGFPDYDLTIWIGLLAPAATPKPEIERLRRATHAALAAPALRESFEAIGAVPGHASPLPFDQLISEEARKWAQVVERTGVRADAP